MKRPPIDAAQQAVQDALAENDRNRWLVRNGHRTYASSSSSPRRGRVSGVQESRPSVDAGGQQLNRRGRGDIEKGRRSPSLGADLMALGLFGCSFTFGMIGVVWAGVEVARWIGELITSSGGRN